MNLRRHSPGSISALLLISNLVLIAAATAAVAVAVEPHRPELTKLPMAWHKGMENTPLVFKGRPLLLMNRRDDTKVNTEGYLKGARTTSIAIVR